MNKNIPKIINIEGLPLWQCAIVTALVGFYTPEELGIIFGFKWPEDEKK